MAYAIRASQNTLNTSATTSVTTTYGSTATAGNFLVATVFAGGIGLGSIAISGWSVAVSASFLSAADAVAILYKIAVGTETGVTATCSGASSMVLAIHEFSGGTLQSTQTWLDQSNSNNTASLVTTLGTGSITTTKPKELIISVMTFPTGGTSAWSWGQGMTIMNSNVNLSDAYLVDENISAINPTATWTGLSTAGGCVASFFIGSTSASGANYTAPRHVIVGDGMSRAEVAN